MSSTACNLGTRCILSPNHFVNCHIFVSNFIFVKNGWTRDTAPLNGLIWQTGSECWPLSRKLKLYENYLKTARLYTQKPCSHYWRTAHLITSIFEVVIGAIYIMLLKLGQLYFQNNTNYKCWDHSIKVKGWSLIKRGDRPQVIGQPKPGIYWCVEYQDWQGKGRHRNADSPHINNGHL